MNKRKKEFYQKLADIIDSAYAMSETGVSEVLTRPFKLGSGCVVRIPKYIPYIPDFDYKAFKHNGEDKCNM